MQTTNRESEIKTKAKALKDKPNENAYFGV